MMGDPYSWERMWAEYWQRQRAQAQPNIAMVIRVTYEEQCVHGPISANDVLDAHEALRDVSRLTEVLGARERE